jgi:hypothetical protein
LFNSRRVVWGAGRLSGLAALAAIGLVSSGAAAGATTGSGPGISAAPIMAAVGSAPQTLAATYGCDLSPLHEGLGSLNIEATLSLPGSGTEGDKVPAVLTTKATPLSPAISNALPALDSIELAGNAPVYSILGHSVALTGQSGTVLANAAELPSMTASGLLALTAAGTTTLHLPSTITLTLTSQGTALPAVKCSTSDASVKISVTAPPTPAPVPSGPVYKCSEYLKVSPGKSHLVGTMSGPIPFVVSATGPQTTGSTDTVSLSVPGGIPGGMPGSPPPFGVNIAFASGLPVTGAQPGEILIAKHTTDLKSLPLGGSGHLYLAKPGTDRVLYPRWFTLAVVTVVGHGKPISITGTLSCTLETDQTAVALRLHVTGQPTPIASATGAAGGTAASGAVPAGAPNTGGGPRPGSGLPMAIGGGALLLTGAGFVVAAARRRRGQAVS